MSPLVPLDAGQATAFWICAPLMVLLALGMVASRKAVHSALCIAGVMICLAVQYAALGAPFLFVAQIIVYTGAIMMLFLFVVMIVGVDVNESFVETIKGHRWLSLLAVLGVLGLLVFGIGHSFVGSPVGMDAANRGGNLAGLAYLIFNQYVFAFEVTSALLITAAVGAMVMAHPERLRPKVTQPEAQRQRVQRYAQAGAHPGARPGPGLFARRNAIDVPALLPDGSVAEESVSQTLVARGYYTDPQSLGAPTRKAFETIETAKRGELEE